MKAYVYVGCKVATLVIEGTPEHEAMRELPHLQCEAERECDTVDDAIQWFNQWSQVYWGMASRQI